MIVHCHYFEKDPEPNLDFLMGIRNLICFLYILIVTFTFVSCLMINSQEIMKLWVAMNVQDHFSNPAPSVFLFFMYIYITSFIFQVFIVPLWKAANSKA